MASLGQFAFDERLGLVFIVETACLSAAAICCLLSYIVYGAVKIAPGASRKWRTGTHVHFYFLSLLLSDLIQAIGSIMDIKWIADSGVEQGPFCTAQGIFKQMGDVGVALATLAIAVHTFAVLVFRWRPDPSPRLAIIVVTTIWVFMGLIVGLSLGTHKGKVYYGDTQYWCWITGDYPAQRIALEYFWLWFTAFLNIILYVPIALVLKGYIVMDSYKLRIPKNEEPTRLHLSSSNGMKDAGVIAMQMLFYPAVYTITVLPIAVVRWRAFDSQTVPFPATVVAEVLFSSSGLLNVLLFTITRPALLPARDRPMRAFFNTTVLSEVISDSQGFQTSPANSPSDVHGNWPDSWPSAPRRLSQSFLSSPQAKPTSLDSHISSISPISV